VAISTLTETQIINSGTLALGTAAFGSTIVADQYLYLVGQGTSNAAYTAGRLLIEIFGYDA
jgi:translation initiation factor 6 (eIF-6)